MLTLETNGVCVNVETFFAKNQANHQANEYFFAYRITIKNNTKNVIQLLRRHWRIAESNGSVRTVDGEGVVGQQPILDVDEQYQYTSGCNIHAEIGKMDGIYTFLNMATTEHFEVVVPAFKLVVPDKLN